MSTFNYNTVILYTLEILSNVFNAAPIRCENKYISTLFAKIIILKIEGLKLSNNHQLRHIYIYIYD